MLRQVKGNRARSGRLEQALLLGIGKTRHRIHLVGPGKRRSYRERHKPACTRDEHSAS